MTGMMVLLPSIVLSALVECEPVCWHVADKVPYESVTESDRLYDDDKREMIQGVIADIETVTLKDGARFMQILVQSAEHPVRVHLGPDWYMSDKINRLELDVGRAVQVVGSYNVVAGQRVLVAGEITNTRRNEHLRLRHPSGIPAWASGEYLHEDGSNVRESRP